MRKPPASAIVDLRNTRRELELATVKLATVQAENRRLRRMDRKRARGPAAASNCSRRQTDLRLALGGLQREPPRGPVLRHVSPRWAWAVALLERARVVVADAPYLDEAFDADADIGDAIEAIDPTVKALESSGLASLVMRLPNNGRVTRWRSQ